MSYKNKPNLKRSLGALRKAKKTKAKAPDLLGKLNIEQLTLRTIANQLERSGSSKVVCNLAGWINVDHAGQYITVELQPCYTKSLESEESETQNIFDFISSDTEGEDN
jgi:hypothetical protein